MKTMPPIQQHTKSTAEQHAANITILHVQHDQQNQHDAGYMIPSGPSEPDVITPYSTTVLGEGSINEQYLCMRE